MLGIGILASIKTARFWLKAAPYLLGLAVVGGAIIRDRLQTAKIERQQSQLYDLTVQLKSEKADRLRDVAGLTVLAQGMTKAAVETKQDETVLRNTINAANPSPSSAQLSAFLDGLRTADRGAKQPTTPTGR